MAASGPIVFLVQGDRFPESCCIATIIWEGATTSGDRVELRKLDGGELIWPGRTNTTQTYIGANLGPSGVSCSKGFHAAVLMSGRLCIYLRED